VSDFIGYIAEKDKNINLVAEYGIYRCLLGKNLPISLHGCLPPELIELIAKKTVARDQGRDAKRE